MRWETEVQHLPDPEPGRSAKRPVFDGKFKFDLYPTARLYAQAYPSDPFAFARMVMLLKQGHALASDVRTEARSVVRRHG